MCTPSGEGKEGAQGWHRVSLPEGQQVKASMSEKAAEEEGGSDNVEYLREVTERTRRPSLLDGGCLRPNLSKK